MTLIVPFRDHRIAPIEPDIAPHVALKTTPGPYITTQRPLNSTPRAFKAPHVALKTTTEPSSTTQRPLNSTPRACI